MQAVAAKKEALGRWNELAHRGRLLSSSLDLSELLHPGTFLNALRQESSRRSKQPLDSLKLISGWEKERIKAPIRVCVKGLLLQGAVFEDGILEEAGTSDQELLTFQAGVSPDSATLARQITGRTLPL